MNDEYIFLYDEDKHRGREVDEPRGEIRVGGMERGCCIRFGKSNGHPRA